MGYSRTGKKARNVYMTDEEFDAYREWIRARREGAAKKRKLLAFLEVGAVWLDELRKEASAM